MNRRDLVCVMALLILSAVLHGIGLGIPNAVVFDEVYFGKFVTAYTHTAERFFDIHPPHAKLLIAALAKLDGYRGNFSFRAINQSYEGVAISALRLAPAVAGSLLSPVFFLFLRALGATLAAAWLGGLVIALDNGILVQTRIIALDGFLLLFILSSIWALLMARKPVNSRARLAWLILSGICCGLAVGTKYTGLVAPAMLTLMAIREWARQPSWENGQRWTRYFLCIVSSALLVYLAGWLLHFALLHRAGEGDDFYQLTYDFAKDFVGLQKTMLQLNAGLRKPHAYASAWWSWPLMKAPVFYWQGQGNRLFFIGNPAVWFGSTVFFLLSLLMISIRKRAALGKSVELWLPIVGFFGSYLPYVAVGRPLFLYHYLPCLLFSLATVILWLDRTGWIKPRGLGQQRCSYYLAIAAVVAGFLLVLPLTYGTRMGVAHEAMVAGLLDR